MAFLKMGEDLTNFAEVQGKLATAREENRELDAALTAANLRVAELEASLETVDIVFDGPPSHESGRFVEVEDLNGRSIKLGEWVHRDDGYWVLRLTAQRGAEVPHG